MVLQFLFPILLTQQIMFGFVLSLGFMMLIHLQTTQGQGQSKTSPVYQARRNKLQAQSCGFPSAVVGRRVAGLRTAHLLSVMFGISIRIVLYLSHMAVKRSFVQAKS